MTLGTDFSLPGGPGETPAESPTAQPPVIVIEYRSRGLASRLMPAALILFSAVAISSYQRKTPVWPLIPRPHPVAVDHVAQKDKSGAEAAEARPVDPPPVLIVEPAQPSTSASALADRAGSGRQPSPFDHDMVDGLHPLEATPDSPKANSYPEPIVTSPERGVDSPRPTTDDPLPAAAPLPVFEDSPAPPPQAAPETSRDEILRDIEREGEQKDARRQDLEGLKMNARSLLLNEALSKVHANRVAFHDELKQLLNELKDNAGEEIGKLCERYGKEAMPQVKSAYAKLLRTAPKRMSRQARVEMMRGVGVPEPLVLDQLCHEFDKLINTRGGPRTEDEVRVRAARALLALPVSPAARKIAPDLAEPRTTTDTSPHAEASPAAGFGRRP